MENIITFVPGKSPATSSLLILQDGNVAKAEGCSGATGVACPLLIVYAFIVSPSFIGIIPFKIFNYLLPIPFRYESNKASFNNYHKTR